MLKIQVEHNNLNCGSILRLYEYLALQKGLVAPIFLSGDVLLFFFLLLCEISRPIKSSQYNHVASTCYGAHAPYLRLDESRPQAQRFTRPTQCFRLVRLRTRHVAATFVGRGERAGMSGPPPLVINQQEKKEISEQKNIKKGAY